METVVVVICYLFLLIILGVVSARFFRGGAADYFVASRSIGPLVLFMSVFGTTMTAFAMVGSTAEAYRVGVATYGKIASASALIHSACFFFIGLKLWGLGKRHGYMTQIEFFRDRFESSAFGYVLFPILVSLLVPYLLVGLMGAGSVMKGITMGAFPETFPGTNGAIPPALTSAVISCVVLFYIFLGGVRSAAWANTFQTIVFMIMGCLAFILIANMLGGMGKASVAADTAKAVREGNITELQFLTYCFIPLSVGMFPHLFQNCLTAKSAKTFKFLLVAHPIAIMVTWIPCILIGFWATGVLPDVGNPNAVLGIMLKRLDMPIIVGFVSAGVLAAIMSSLDSQFVSVGTMFTRDIVIHAMGKDKFSEQTIVWMARGFIALIVIVTYLFTLANPAQVFALGIWCFSGFASLCPLVLAALYWRRTTKAGAFAAVIVTALVWTIMFADADFGAERGYVIAGMMPAAILFATCAATIIVVSLLTKPPSEATIEKFFPKKS